MKIADRLLTIAVTATLTSAVWIMFGAGWLELAQDRQDDDAPATMDEQPGGVESADEPGLADDRQTTASAGMGSLGATGLVIPVAGIAGTDLSDSFLDDRGPDDQRTHEAIDIMAPAGTPVVAATNGTLAKLHRSDRGGNSIYVRSPDRLRIHYYAHLDNYAPGLREGQRIRAGQTLGTVGSSGNAGSSAPHLHFEISETTADARWWEPSTAINPYPLLREASSIPVR
ncbi:M23 family metallopeptidase [Erythrobacter sp.]|uniref:M23 family metallopeptidase n=1 Tax=Erythrobacter sp. TaxID=1042 RepID=UPI003C71161C